MTVHGAKGLEAPLVVLIDGCEVLGRDPPLLAAARRTRRTSRSGRPGKSHDSGAMARGPRDPARARATRSTTGCSTWP